MRYQKLVCQGLSTSNVSDPLIITTSSQGKIHSDHHKPIRQHLTTRGRAAAFLGWLTNSISRHMETVIVHRICFPGEESRYQTVSPRFPGNLAHLGQGSANDTAQGPNRACKCRFIGTRPHSLVYTLPWRTGTPVAGQQSQWRPHMAKSKTFTMWPFGEFADSWPRPFLRE